MYFSHDDSAQNDAKIIALRKRFGWQGYGIFWALIERLARVDSYELDFDVDSLAWDLREENEIVQSVICDFGLFKFTEDGKRFYSKSLIRRKNWKEETKRKTAEAHQKAGKLGGRPSKKDKQMLFDETNDNQMVLQETKDNQMVLDENQTQAKSTKEKKEKETERKETETNESARETNEIESLNVSENDFFDETDETTGFPKPPFPETEIIDAWNDVFAGTKQVYRGVQLDAVSHERAGESWKAFGELETFREAFKQAKADDFVWLLSATLKPENIQRLLAKGEKENDRSKNSFRGASARDSTRRNAGKAGENNFADQYDWSQFERK